MKKQFTLAFAVIGLIIGVAVITPVFAEQTFVSIGTGGVTGVYYPAGNAICRLVNKTRKEHSIRCSAESTGGSIYNINTIRSGELDFGVVQSDWQYHAYNGTSKFKNKGPFKGLRALFALHPEPVTIVARDDSGISNITDLKGKRVNVGNPGSGSRGTWEVVRDLLGWTNSDLALAAGMKSSEVGAALCDDKIDAYFWLVGHPSSLTQESLTSCATHLVHVAAPEIDKLVTDKPYFRKTIIPASIYDSKEDIKSFGVGATFVTSVDVPTEIVYAIVKAVFDDLNQFKKLHPAFGHLKAKEMIKETLSIPLHKGAIKYYKEKGWM